MIFAHMRHPQDMVPEHETDAPSSNSGHSSDISSFAEFLEDKLGLAATTIICHVVALALDFREHA